MRFSGPRERANRFSPGVRWEPTAPGKKVELTQRCAVYLHLHQLKCSPNGYPRQISGDLRARRNGFGPRCESGAFLLGRDARVGAKPDYDQNAAVPTLNVPLHPKAPALSILPQIIPVRTSAPSKNFTGLIEYLWSDLEKGNKHIWDQGDRWKRISLWPNKDFFFF